MAEKKKLRVFAGPNGSGKSTLTEKIREKHFSFGVYINADEIKKGILSSHAIDFASYQVDLDFQAFVSFIRNSSLSSKHDVESIVKGLRCEGNVVFFDEETVVEDYFFQIIADFLREVLITEGKQLTFETVLSHPSKLDLLKRAKQQGYKVYLYFVSLASPDINIERVKSRVVQGGHDVPHDKIIQRYQRSMDNLYTAMTIADSVYLFDNSYQGVNFFARKEDGALHIEKMYVPQWFDDFVLKKYLKQHQNNS